MLAAVPKAHRTRVCPCARLRRPVDHSVPSIASASPLLPRRVITQPSAGTPTDTGRLADSAIGALRTHHEDLATRVRGFDDDDLGRRSGASGRQVAQVLGHLGSGAEITLAGLQAAVSGAERPGRDFNAAVWDRWNAMTPREQAEGFLVANQALGSAFENLNGTARRDIRIDLGFLPFPADLALFSGMRLNEAALHGWDVRVRSIPTPRYPPPRRRLRSTC